MIALIASIGRIAFVPTLLLAWIHVRTNALHGVPLSRVQFLEIMS